MSEYYKELTNSADTDIGVLPEHTYSLALPPGVRLIRHFLLSRLPDESKVLARHQKFMRKWLGHKGDVFFVYTSLLGTHSFFLIFLPLTFWLGAQRNGRGLVAVTALGCWLSSFVKDLLCLPRPYAPPMRRLAIGTHHLEYGFPSTHTTNCVSMALYAWMLLKDRTEAALEPGSYLPLVAPWVQLVVGIALSVYAISVSYGRLYSGMHSIMDVTGGAILGALVIPLQRSLQPWLETQLLNPSLLVPTSIISIIMLLFTLHPQPVEDCPCFEDAVAFMAVLAGVNVGRWAGFKAGLLVQDDDPLHMKAKMDLIVPRASVRLTWGEGRLQTMIESGLDLIKSVVNPIVGVPELGSTSPWALRATIIVPFLVILLGTTSLVVTRLVAKSLSRIIVPRTFNLVQKCTQGLAILPRRHYTPAQEYGGVMPQRALSPTPSILDDYEWRSPTPRPQSPLTNASNGLLRAKNPLSDGVHLSPAQMLTSDNLAANAASSTVISKTFTQETESNETGLRQRLVHEKGTIASSSSSSLGMDEDKALPHGVIRHYDADVLIKYITYFCIGFNGAFSVPIVFQRLGWLPLP